MNDPHPVLNLLRSKVIPAVEGYWRADAEITSYLDSRLPGFSAEIDTPTCGFAAISAFFGADAVRPIIEDFAVSWMNRRMMEKALTRLGARYQKIPGKFPSQGTALIQWHGPWSKRDYRGANLIYTHWIAVAEGYIFDVNWPSWLPIEHWETLVADSIQKDQGASGWSVLTSYDLL